MVLTPTPISNSERKSSGSHYTPEELADFVAGQIVALHPSSAPLTLDPACGDGELLLAFKRLRPHAKLVGYDLNAAALAFAGTRIDARLEARDFLELALDHRTGGLFAPTEKFDVVIANPPYVRTQVLGADRSQEISAAFSLSGRVDLYFAFIEGIAEVLRPSGIAGIIVSNRFMTTKAGMAVREGILREFDIIHVWDLGDTRIFEAAVLPAVLVLRKKDRKVNVVAKMSSIYTSPGIADHRSSSPIKALNEEGLVQINDNVFRVQHGNLDVASGTWRLASGRSDQWLETVNQRTTLRFGDIGKIRVGIKTTADKVFVRKAWEAPEPELLRPLLTHRVARRYRSLPAQAQMLYPHTEKDGRKCAVDISQFPRSLAYLEPHRTALESRHYLMEAGRQWFELWVPQQPSLWRLPKLIWPDIAEKPTFWISLEDELVQGDCYWLSPTAGQEDLLWLALAVANSRFAETFYDQSFNNKLYAGRRRFMTQYVENFPLPDPATPLAQSIIRDAKLIFELTPSNEATVLAVALGQKVCEAFGVLEEVSWERDLDLPIHDFAPKTREARKK